jgi:Uma2 family endonuclease
MRNRYPFMSEITRPVTAEELERMGEDARYELVRGQLVAMSPVAGRHAGVSVTVSALLWQHVHPHKLGAVWHDAGFILARSLSRCSRPATDRQR